MGPRTINHVFCSNSYNCDLKSYMDYMLFSLITIYHLIKLWIKIYLILCQSQSSKDIPKLYYHHHFGYYCASNLCYRSVSSEYSVIMRVAWLMFQHLFFCRIMSAKSGFINSEDTHGDSLLDESADHEEAMDTGDDGEDTTEDALCGLGCGDRMIPSQPLSW